MKEEIEKFDRENGNITYSTKEIVKAIYVNLNSLQKDKVDKSTFRWALGFVFTIIILIIGVLLNG